MSFNYNNELLTITDNVRFVLGDIDAESAILEDETIKACIEMYGYYGAIYELGMSLIARFNAEPTTITADGIKIDYTDRMNALRYIVETARKNYKINSYYASKLLN